MSYQLKPSSLFNDGMKPAVFSVKNSKEKGANWDHDGFNITYRKNNIMRVNFYLWNVSYHNRNVNTLIIATIV